MSEHEHECGCGCGCAEEEEIITLINENGEEEDFILLEEIEVDGSRYAILVPVLEGDEEAEEAIILKFDKDEFGNDILKDIEDDEEWEKVADAWQELLEDEEELH
ncbi:MAG: DUF1292 domain-containing protein [Desulfurispora sp.]|uniref:DUF1292 domain-containing protein n=1 Tax=Desulfurispora sp. TaxID=3014275 RepID=UPI0040493398